MKQESFEVICKDGVSLNGILLIPDNPKAVIQFNCGTGTRKEIYLPFLSFLCENGYLCCLWDYRGSGASAPKYMKNCHSTYSDYGVQDMPAIKTYLTNRFSHFPFYIIAHSTGGQQIGFMNNLEGIRGVINFAVSAGYYPNMPFTYRMKACFFFYVFSPISAMLNGFVKAKPLGFMENLPKNVVYEWRSWCAKEDYFFDKSFYGKTIPVGQFKQFKFPIHTFWTTDDTISNEKNTKNFWKHIESDRDISFTKLVPSELGLKKIGHFGFFRKHMKEKLWEKVIEQINKW
ncbi:Alpha/beta hydrolase family protein [compost metagenome]